MLLGAKLENRTINSVTFLMFSLRHKEHSYGGKNIKIGRKVKTTIRYFFYWTARGVRLLDRTKSD